MNMFRLIIGILGTLFLAMALFVFGIGLAISFGLC